MHYKTKMFASSLIFRAIKGCFSFAKGALPPNSPPRGICPPGPPQWALPLHPARGPAPPGPRLNSLKYEK